jgi:hypothetical protein
MRFSQRLFFVAAIYGVAILLPMYFLEGYIERSDPPAITHPEYFYGFIGAALAWQLVYLVIASDPARYRPMILVGIFAKLNFGAAVWLLVALGRTSLTVGLGAAGDLVFAGLFAYAYTLLSGQESAAERRKL